MQTRALLNATHDVAKSARANVAAGFVVGCTAAA